MGTLHNTEIEANLNVVEMSHSTPHKKFKAMPPAKKVMTRTFWYNQGVLLVDFLTHGATGNAASCAKQEAIRHKQQGLLTTGVLLHNNA